MFRSAARRAIYADYNATVPLRPEARAAMLEAMDVGANASSVHGPGRQARAIIERARDQVSFAIGCCRDDLTFTSGATESSASVFATLRAQWGDALAIVASGIEHPAISSHVQSDVHGLVGADGVLDLAATEAVLSGLATAGRQPCLALMLANNETGVIQPVEDAVSMARRYGAVVICDAVQALGKIPVSVVDLDVDYLIVSGHKVGGPQGVGAVYARPGAALNPVLSGGRQETGRRPGTENLIGIAGFGAAAEASVAGLKDMKRLQIGRDRMEARLKSEAGVTIFGETAPRLAQTSCLALEGFASETQVMAMDLAGVAVSAGAACSSGKVRVSGVLTAMGVRDDLASCALRISLGWDTQDDEFDRIADLWLAAARRAGHVASDNKESA